MRAEICLEFHTFKLFLMIIMRGQGKTLSISVDLIRDLIPLGYKFRNIEASPLNDIQNDCAQ